MGIKRILIAEDSPTQALQLQMILEENNFEVIHGLNGKEALDLIDDSNPPDIIISDILMPIMDGYEFCKKIKQDEKLKEIPVILLTQLSNPEDVIKGLQAGADNFLSKPYSEKFLFERIKDILLNLDIRKRSPNLDISMEIYFGGRKYKLNSNRMQILDLLLSTYHNAINKNKELEDKNIQLKELHSELKLKNNQLKLSIDEKNHFLGIAAHDLRSPLCLVSSYFDLVTDSLEDNAIDDQNQILSTINNTLDYMLNLITDVLDYAKIESGKLDLKIEEFNLITFMNQVIELTNILSAQKNIKILPAYSNDEIFIKADQNKLKQVMDNLLSNAIKYSEQNTKVYIYISNLENEIKVEVADQGKGIPKDELSKLFQPFTITSVKSTAGERSTGLGLVSVKKIIETHGGKIWVESEKGIGSQFYFTIPFETSNNKVTETKKPKPATRSPQPETNTSKIKILIVEDDKPSTEHLSIILRNMASEIIFATNGEEGINKCKMNPDIDLVLMNINMSKMDGYEATKNIREFNKDVIIIAQTAYAIAGEREKVLAAGCDDYISKPIKREALLKLLDKHLNKKRKR